MADAAPKNSGIHLWLVLMKAHRALSRGRRIDLTSGSITTAIDRLQKRGLVVRGLDGDDRRTRIVRLTPAGRARIAEVFSEHAAALEAASKGLTKAERKSLIALLKKLGIAAERDA